MAPVSPKPFSYTGIGATTDGSSAQKNDKKQTDKAAQGKGESGDAQSPEEQFKILNPIISQSLAELESTDPTLSARLKAVTTFNAHIERLGHQLSRLQALKRQYQEASKGLQQIDKGVVTISNNIQSGKPFFEGVVREAQDVHDTPIEEAIAWVAGRKDKLEMIRDAFLREGKDVLAYSGDADPVLHEVQAVLHHKQESTPIIQARYADALGRMARESKPDPAKFPVFTAAYGDALTPYLLSKTSEGESVLETTVGQGVRKPSLTSLVNQLIVLGELDVTPPGKMVVTSDDLEKIGPELHKAYLRFVSALGDNGTRSNEVKDVWFKFIAEVGGAKAHYGKTALESATPGVEGRYAEKVDAELKRLRAIEDKPPFSEMRYSVRRTQKDFELGCKNLAAPWMKAFGQEIWHVMMAPQMWANLALSAGSGALFKGLGALEVAVTAKWAAALRAARIGYAMGGDGELHLIGLNLFNTLIGADQYVDWSPQAHAKMILLYRALDACALLAKGVTRDGILSKLPDYGRMYVAEYGTMAAFNEAESMIKNGELMPALEVMEKNAHFFVAVRTLQSAKLLRKHPSPKLLEEEAALLKAENSFRDKMRDAFRRPTKASVEASKQAYDKLVHKVDDLTRTMLDLLGKLKD